MNIDIHELLQRGVYGLNDDRYKWYDQLRKNERLTRAELLSLRNQYCYDLLLHAYDTVPFYKKRFADCGIHRDDISGVETLEKLPPLTKADLRDHEAELKSTDPTYSKMTRITSGGSTGEFSVIWRSRVYNSASRGCMMRNWGLVGWNPSDKAIWFWGAPYEHEVASANLISRFLVHVKSYKFLNTYSFDPSRFPEWYSEARRFKPKAVYGYAKVLKAFSEYMIKEGLSLPSVKVVVSSVEKLESRELISQAFDAPVYDQYGCREILALGIEVAPNKMLIPDDCVVIRPKEFHSEITALHSYGFPLINYKLGDVLKMEEQESLDDWPFTVADLKIGRETDYFVTEQGKYVSASALSVYVSQQNHSMREQQFIQHGVHHFEIRFVPDAGLVLGHYKQDMYKVINEYFGEHNEIEFLQMDSIPPEPSGKKLMFKRKYRPENKA